MLNSFIYVFSASSGYFDFDFFDFVFAILLVIKSQFCRTYFQLNYGEFGKVSVGRLGGIQFANVDYGINCLKVNPLHV